jgi:leucyl-tRNA synthetase
MKIKLKVNDEGFAYVEDGMPVFIHEDDDNKESPMDVVKVMTGLDAKNKAQSEEIKRHVEGKEKLKTQLEAYEGIDPEKYKENAEFVEKHKDTKLVDEQGVETLKRKMKENFEALRSGKES